MLKIRLILLFSIIWTVCSGQARRVKDVNSKPAEMQEAGHGGYLFVPTGDHAYFKVVSLKGMRWWVTDGTPTGTNEIDNDAPAGYDYSLNGGGANGAFIYQTLTGDGSTRLKKYTPRSGSQILKEFATELAILVRLSVGEKVVSKKFLKQ